MLQWAWTLLPLVSMGFCCRNWPSGPWNMWRSDWALRLMWLPTFRQTYSCSIRPLRVCTKWLLMKPFRVFVRSRWSIFVALMPFWWLKGSHLPLLSLHMDRRHWCQCSQSVPLNSPSPYSPFHASPISHHDIKVIQRQHSQVWRRTMGGRWGRVWP